MVLRSDLANWQAGNVSKISTEGLIKIAEYFECAAHDDFIEAAMLIDEDIEEGETDVENE